MKKLFAILLAVMMLLAMTGCGKGDQEKTPATDVLVVDAESKVVRLSNFLGKPVVINIWASWCEPCKAEMSGFQQQFEAVGDQVQFMMINVTDGENETMESARAFIEAEGFTFPVYYDVLSNAVMNLGVQTLPTTIFVDAEGNIVAQYSELVTAQMLQDGIDMIYKGE